MHGDEHAFMGEKPFAPATTKLRTEPNAAPRAEGPFTEAVFTEVDIAVLALPAGRKTLVEAEKGGFDDDTVAFPD